MKKKWLYLMVIIPLAIALAGCGANRTTKGAGAGAVAGGLLGAIIGHQSGHKEGGAVIGAAAGAGIGGLIGYRMEQQAKKLETVRGMENVTYNEDTKEIDATMNILFDFDKAAIRPSEKTKLDELARVFSDYPENIVIVEGHTDSKGSAAYNKRLSELRASRVAEYLRSKNLDISSLTARGYGESQPVATNETAAGREQNRRVDLQISADPERVPEDAPGRQG
ncbi:MAG: OmpA family protein [Desulfobacteraceae bacterium]|nr:OmpA family protein [Desulfobacteraceae bacterium]